MQYQYLSTHPFLTFQVDVHAIPAIYWKRVYQLQRDIQAQDDSLQQVEAKALASELSFIKGVTGTKQYQPREIENVQDAFCYIIDAALNPDSDFKLSADAILKLHRQLYDGVNVPLEEFEYGAFRGRNVKIRGYGDEKDDYYCPTYEECPFLITRLCNWICESMQAMPNDRTLVGGFYLSALFHYYFVAIHPFRDGNGRIARLLELYILLKMGFPIAHSILPWNIYVHDRDAMNHCLEKRGKAPDALAQFLMFVLNQYEQCLASAASTAEPAMP